MGSRLLHALAALAFIAAASAAAAQGAPGTSEPGRKTPRRSLQNLTSFSMVTRKPGRSCRRVSSVPTTGY